MNEYRLVVGLRLDKPEYYLGFHPVRVDNSDYRSVRSMLRDHLDELEGQASALRAVLATQDPEEAERLLQDSVRMQCSEVILRPRLSVGDYLARLHEATPDALLDEMRRTGDGTA
ncbi:MAG TPA: hypothetical protein VME66_14540 [Candidatus Acidoferrales bacterium]|nr:hypothetical protein [Candidatus Acidoferrales bacterium]